MKYRMERLVLLPFSAGCISDSTIAVAVHRPRRSKPDGERKRTEREAEEEEEEEEEGSLSDESTKSLNRSLMAALPKHYKISSGIHRFFKSFSQLFVEKDEEEEEEETEKEMEIGGPTDVKHVTHIGVDAPPNEDITMAGLHDLLMINANDLHRHRHHHHHSLSAPSDLHDRDPLYPYPPIISPCPST